MNIPTCPIKQRTVARQATCSGIGVHSGKKARLTIKPASANRGIRFVRTDLPGTPMISDPGHLLLRGVWDAQAAGASVRVVPLPGPSAVLTALSACPLPLHQFSFAGFLPAKSTGRRSRLQELLGLPGAFVSNLTFGGPDYGWLYASGRQGIYRLQMQVRGVGWD